MNVKLIETAEKVGFNVDGRKMFTSPKTEIIHLDIKFGEVIEMHSNPFDVVFYVLEGAGIIETPDEQITVEPDQDRRARAMRLVNLDRCFPANIFTDEARQRVFQYYKV